MRRDTSAASIARQLRNLVQLFSLDDLRELEAEIGATGEVEGDTVVQRAASLVEWAADNEKQFALTVGIVHRRPEAKWD